MSSTHASVATDDHFVIPREILHPLIHQLHVAVRGTRWITDLGGYLTGIYLALSVLRANYPDLEGGEAI